MLPNAFTGHAEEPTPAELAHELGTSKKLWDDLIAALANQQGITGKEWNSYSKKAGWSLKLKRANRTIVYLSPCKGCFRVSFALGDEALACAERSGLPANVIKLMREAKKYAEGTAVRIDVSSAADVEVVKKLAAAKIRN